MGDFDPAPGTRVTVDGATFEWRETDLEWCWVCLPSKPPLVPAPNRERALTRLARYAAIGEEAAEHVGREYPSNTLFNHAAQGVADKLAAEWRAQQEGR